jgi:hypothetical protein
VERVEESWGTGAGAKGAEGGNDGKSEGDGTHGGEEAVATPLGEADTGGSGEDASALGDLGHASGCRFCCSQYKMAGWLQRGLIAAASVCEVEQRESAQGFNNTQESPGACKTDNARSGHVCARARIFGLVPSWRYS